VTVVSGPDATLASDFTGGIRLLGGTRGSLRNLLVVGQPHPEAYVFDVDGAETWARLIAGDLTFDSSLIAGYGQLGDQDADPPQLGTLYSTDAEGQYLRLSGLGNRIVHEFALQDSVLRGAYASVPDLRPVPLGVVASSECGTSLPPFDPAPYCGALPPPNSTLGAIPWMEPAPLVGTVGTPVTPIPGYAIVVVAGMRAGQPQFPLPGVLLGAGISGSTDASGLYRAYVAAAAAGTGASGFIITIANLPPGCSNPGPVINIGPSSGQEQVYGVPVVCN
jgi:hypothetical protein